MYEALGTLFVYSNRGDAQFLALAGQGQAIGGLERKLIMQAYIYKSLL